MTTDKDLTKAPNPSDPITGAQPPKVVESDAEKEAKAKEEAGAKEKAEAEKLEAEAKAKEEAEKKAKEKEEKTVSKEDMQKYAYLTRLLNIENPELTPAEVIRYEEIIQHTGFTPELLLEIIKDPSCKENYLVKGDEKIQLITNDELLIVSKALSKKISKDISSYTEKDWDAETWAYLNKYWVNLTDLKKWLSAIAEKVVDPKTGKVDNKAVDKIIKWFEAICLR